MARLQEFTDEQLITEADKYLEVCEEDTSILPSIDGLCYAIGISDDWLLARAKELPELLATISVVKRLQKIRLMQGGLGGSWKERMSMFLLNVNHGMHETNSNENKNENINLNADLTEDEQRAIIESTLKARGEKTEGQS